jgi:mono/diheme cytochrome c family protein
VPSARLDAPGWLAAVLALGALTSAPALGLAAESESTALEQQGRLLYDQHRCASCHTPAAAVETGIFVSLDDLADRYTPSLLAELLDAPPPEMPRFILSAEDRRALAAYLLRSER